MLQAPRYPTLSVSSHRVQCNIPTFEPLLITTVESKPENIMKLTHYMHNGLSIYQTKYGTTTFLVLPRPSYIIFNRPVVGKTTLLRQKSQQTHYYCRIATRVAESELDSEL